MKKWLLILSCLISFAVKASPLPASEVFQLSLKPLDPNTFLINWDIKPGYFLYSNRIQLSAKPDSNLQLGPIRFPQTLSKTDKQGHTFPIYRNQLTLPVGVLGTKAGESLLDLRYQGCSDAGFCYPPVTKQLKVTINDKLAVSSISLETPIGSTNKIETSDKSISHLLAHHNWLVTLLIFYGFGLLLSFTPCILPMVPVLSGIIVGHSKEVTTKKAFFLSLSYVLSMSITYAIVGAVVALAGANLQIRMQSPWAISLFSLIFFLLALSMFGFYEFKLPQSWQSKISGPDNQHRRGHYLGAALMGCLSTLILSPCVTAPLIGVLAYIAQTGNILLGSLTLFILSLGMGTPLLLIGTSAGKLLPKSGSWMNEVKGFFGVMLLAVAIYLMARIVPDLITMGLWASLFIFTGIYIGALNPSFNKLDKFRQGLGIMVLVYGLLILIGLSMGATNPIQPLTAFQNHQPSNSIKYQKVSSLKGINEAINKAFGKPIMLDFYADWCTSCKIMEATTFKDARVQEAMKQFAIIKINVTTNDQLSKDILSHFNVIAPPTFVFFDAQGKELYPLKLVGERSADEFLKILNQVGSSI